MIDPTKVLELKTRMLEAAGRGDVNEFTLEYIAALGLLAGGACLHTPLGEAVFLDAFSQGAAQAAQIMGATSV